MAAKEHRFQTNGKVLVNPGWLAVYGKEAQDGRREPGAGAAGETVRTGGRDRRRAADQTAGALHRGDAARRDGGAGKLIDDDELREAMIEKGLGTPATRSAIIEGLINEKYMHREGRS